jgi:predicted nucleic acid-binding protein
LVTHVPWRCIERVRALCDIVEVGQSTCDDAMALRKRHNDFEDDLIIASAKEAGAECVITSDAELIAHFPEYCTTPRTIVASMG